MEAASLLSNQETARARALVNLTRAKKNSCGPSQRRRFAGWRSRGFDVERKALAKKLGKGPGGASPEGGYA